MISLKISIPEKLMKDKRFEQELKDTLFEVSQKIRNDAVRNAPYRSWNLRRSILAKQEWLKARIGTNVVYARIQEYGWIITPKRRKYLTFKIWWKRVRTKQVRIRWKRYLTRAFYSNRERIKNYFTKSIEKYLQSISK